MELEKQMAIFRVEQTESTRKVDDLQDAKARVSGGVCMHTPACVACVSVFYPSMYPLSLGRGVQWKN